MRKHVARNLMSCIFSANFGLVTLSVQWKSACEVTCENLKLPIKCTFQNDIDKKIKYIIVKITKTEDKCSLSWFAFFG